MEEKCSGIGREWQRNDTVLGLAIWVFLLLNVFLVRLGLFFTSAKRKMIAGRALDVVPDCDNGNTELSVGQPRKRQRAGIVNTRSQTPRQVFFLVANALGNFDCEPEA
jgi:hypothetical protein